MSFFGSSPSASQAPADMTARKEAVMNSVREELALHNAQELLNKANEKCFAKCVTKPGASLSSGEEACLSRCFQQFVATYDIITRSYTARINKERQEGTDRSFLQ
ncbi:Tim10/DDP family zinc finger-domain-containing protein [Cyathus striatus]|nr:Tim10/DDP family zinc finger-domain-containing protein [Cyathus striatus]